VANPTSVASLAAELRPVTQPAAAAPAQAPAKASAAPAQQQAAAPAARPVVDSVTISPAAQAKVPIATQVRVLSRQGESAIQIANKLGLSVQAVTSYLGTPQAPAQAK
jgi:hypothetical protein